MNFPLSNQTYEDLSCIEIEPSIPAKHSIIWLHGLGADGSDFVPIVSELKLAESLAVRFLFPHAPVIPVTINNGYAMRAWYDIFALTHDAKIDAEGIQQSANFVQQLIEKEIERGIASEHIILAGFSQGAVIALSTGLIYSKPLAGVIALSGYLPLADELLQKASAANRNLPIFLAHGTEDTVVPYALGKVAYLTLRQAGYQLTWRSYKMTHSVCAEEIADIRQWINSAFL